MDITTDNTHLFEVPQDKNYLVLLCFCLIGFVAWFPVFFIFSALPYYSRIYNK